MIKVLRMTHQIFPVWVAVRGIMCPPRALDYWYIFDQAGFGWMKANNLV
jgi:hypothetical protein